MSAPTDRVGRLAERLRLRYHGHDEEQALAVASGGLPELDRRRDAGDVQAWLARIGNVVAWAAREPLDWDDPAALAVALEHVAALRVLLDASDRAVHQRLAELHEENEE